MKQYCLLFVLFCILALVALIGYEQGLATGTSRGFDQGFSTGTRACELNSNIESSTLPDSSRPEWQM